MPQRLQPAKALVLNSYKAAREIREPQTAKKAPSDMPRYRAVIIALPNSATAQ